MDGNSIRNSINSIINNSKSITKFEPENTKIEIMESKGNNKLRTQNDKANEYDSVLDLELSKSPAHELDAIFPNTNSDNFNSINRNNNQNQKDSNAKDNLMPNPDDFDEGDDEDSEGKGARTPGL